MGLKLPQQALLDELQALVDSWNASGTWDCHLFTNNVTPGTGTILGTFIEGTWAGYAEQPLAAWLPPTWVPPDASVTESAVVVFHNTSGAPVTLYGYFLTDGDGEYRWGERDPLAPVTLQDGQTYSITLRRTHRNLGD